MTENRLLAAVVWPGRHKSLVMGALRAALGPDAPAAAARGDSKDLPILVEYEDFPQGVIARYEAAVAKGAPDSAEAFRRFASEEFGAFRAFRTRWIDLAKGGAARGPRLVVPRAALRADPGSWLQAALALADPARAATLDGAAINRLVARATAWLARQPAPDPAAFRHYDPALFALLGRLTLPRKTVQETFLKLMGRDIDERAILRFQTEQSPGSLRQVLSATPEYTRQHRHFVRYDEVSAQELLKPGFQKIQTAHKTRLGWPLAQVFVSQRSRVLYCPIGKVACTFLKRQMVRISDVAHADTIIDHVHALTDTIITGLQLSDYPQQEARAFIDAPDYFRFAVLRNPRDRLLSAYIEKFVIGRTNTGNIRHTREVVAKVQGIDGATEPDFDRGITFRQFVSTVTGSNPARLDPHWRPQTQYLAGIRYDRLFRIEDIDSVIDMLEERSGRTLPRQAQNVTGSGNGTPRHGAADLLPADILALPRISGDSFFDDATDQAIAYFFAEDFVLLDQIATPMKP